MRCNRWVWQQTLTLYSSTDIDDTEYVSVKNVNSTDYPSRTPKFRSQLFAAQNTCKREIVSETCVQYTEEGEGGGENYSSTDSTKNECLVNIGILDSLHRAGLCAPIWAHLCSSL